MSPQISGKRILVTGGAGFIGSTLVGRLVGGNDIIVYDDLRRDALHDKPFAEHPRLRIIRADILDSERLEQAAAGAQIVVHCAAVAGIDTVIKKPTETMRVNLIGTANALEAARKQPTLERFVDFSTSEVFGQAAFRAEESQDARIGAVGEARWTYAVSKLAGEHLTRAYHQERGMPTTTVRPFNVYGPGQMGEGAVKEFVTRALRNEDLLIHGEGNQIRAWCYIDDLIDGLLLAMTHPAAVGESFNIGNARAVITVYGLAQTVVRVLESKSIVRFVKRDYADVELRVPSVRKARDVLGFEPKVDLEEGIRRTGEFYRHDRP